jgi:hypothetical protein
LADAFDARSKIKPIANLPPPFNFSDKEIRKCKQGKLEKGAWNVTSEVIKTKIGGQLGQARMGIMGTIYDGAKDDANRRGSSAQDKPR